MRAPRRVQDVVQFQNNNDFYWGFTKHEGAVVDVVDTGVGANTEFEVSHALGFVPDQVEILVTPDQSDAYLAVKPSGTTWTDTSVFLKCNTANAIIRLRLS